VREVDPAVPVVRLRDMDSVFAESIRRPRLLAQLFGAFAGLALLLAAIGTYVQPTDTVTIAFVIATIAAVAVVASWLPAWRASRLDPNVVLRDE
jgi:ABC-type lipoprotein release transport system permease subunit